MVQTTEPSGGSRRNGPAAIDVESAKSDRSARLGMIPLDNSGRAVPTRRSHYTFACGAYRRLQHLPRHDPRASSTAGEGAVSMVEKVLKLVNGPRRGWMRGAIVPLSTGIQSAPEPPVCSGLTHRYRSGHGAARNGDGAFRCDAGTRSSPNGRPRRRAGGRTPNDGVGVRTPDRIPGIGERQRKSWIQMRDSSVAPTRDGHPWSGMLWRRLQ
jgi:hypothetical protein